MAFITTSNSKKLVKKLDLVKFEHLQGQVYKYDIYFLSKREKLILVGIRELLNDPEKFFVEYYSPIVIKDSLSYVYEEKAPAYHFDDNCDRLHSNFRNFEIPTEIQSKGKEEVELFRQWFKENSYTLDKPDVFIMRLKNRWGIVSNPLAIDYSNSGLEDFSNLNLSEVENRIDEIIREAGKYYKENPEKQRLISRFGRLTFLAYVYGDIYNNDSGLNDEDLKTFLKFYDRTFKQPVKELLIQYYRVIHNPTMTFDGSLLEKLNFKQCGACHRHLHSNPDKKN